MTTPLAPSLVMPLRADLVRMYPRGVVSGGRFWLCPVIFFKQQREPLKKMTDRGT